jgi:hypothetical protein
MDDPDATPATAEEITSAQVYKRTLRQLRLIRTQHGISVAEALQKFGGPGIDAEYRRVIAALQADAGDPAFSNSLTDAEAK